MRRVFGAENASTITSLDSLADVYWQQAKYAEAEPLYMSLAEVHRRTLGPQHTDTLDSLAALGGARVQIHKYAEAEPVLREALAGREKIIPNDWHRYNALAMLGESLAGQGKYSESEPLLLSGYAGLVERASKIPKSGLYNLENAGTWIVELYQNWGKAELAAGWRQRIQERKPASASTNK